MKKNDKKQDIIHSAMKIFQETGFEKTSVSQIVKEAGVAQGTFYLYFQSKNDLIPSIAEFIVNELLTKLSQYPETTFKDVPSFIDCLIETTFYITKEYKNLIGFCYSGLSFYKSFEEWEKMYEPYYRYINDKINYFQENDLITSRLSSDVLGNYIVGLLEHGAEMYYLFRNEKDDLNKSKKDLSVALHQLLL